LYDDLNNAIALLSDEMIGKSGGYMTFYQAKHQVDSDIVYHAVHGTSDAVLMNDSDLTAHVGSHCLGIMDFKFIETSTQAIYFRQCSFLVHHMIQSVTRNVATEIGVDADKTKHRIRKP
jgi:hypothetical protein